MVDEVSIIDVGRIIELLREVERALFLVGENPEMVSKGAFEELYYQVADMREKLEELSL